MPKSIRRQTNDRKKALKTDLEIGKRRKQALCLLKEGKRSLRDIAQATNVAKSTLSRIRKCFRNNDDAALQKMLSPSTYKAGAPTVLTSEEESMIGECLIFAAKRGFAVGKDTLKSIMAQIASDGRRGWKGGTPSDDAVRSFRARHREITFRNAENKDKSKCKGETTLTSEGFTGNFPAMISARMRQSDKDAADEIRTIVKDEKDDSRLIQRVATVIENWKTVNIILMNLLTSNSSTTPAREGTSLSPGAPAKHLTDSAVLEERRRAGQEKLREEEESKSAKIIA